MAARSHKPGSTLFVRPAPRDKARALLQLKSLTFQAAIGGSGRTAFKREGDGKTPIAAMAVLYGFYRAERVTPPATPLSLRKIKPDMLWCDAPRHARYNRPVKAPFTASHERLWRDDGLYDFCLVLDWNIGARRRNRGSAIFLHLIRPGYEPTAGCIAIAARDMRRILPLLRKGSTVTVL